MKSEHDRDWRAVILRGQREGILHRYQNNQRISFEENGYLISVYNPFSCKVPLLG